jgi:hypothetical protein
MHQGLQAGFPASYFCIKAFLRPPCEFDVPTLVLHGDNDQIVPIADSALLSPKLVKNAKLEILKGALLIGMCTTRKQEVNEALPSFLRSELYQRSRKNPPINRNRNPTRPKVLLMNNSESNFPPISACCPNRTGIDQRKFIGASAMAATALALPLARGQDSNKAAQSQR